MELLQILMGCKLMEKQRMQAWLPPSEGGLGLGSMKARRASAWIGAWEGGMSAIAAAVGVRSFMELEEVWPEFAVCSEKMDASYNATIGDASKLTVHRWAKYIVSTEAKRQATLSGPVQKQMKKNLESQVSGYERARLYGAGGKEAGAFMFPPEDAKPLPDAHARVALRMRLSVPEVVAARSHACHNTSKEGRTCAEPLSADGGDHAIKCQLGGGWVRRHDAIKDAIYGWMKELGLNPLKEQGVQKWDREDKKAILDLVYMDALEQAVFIDVTVVSSPTTGAMGAGVIMLRREKAKHARYPGPGLKPFVVDVRGRWGVEALAWVRMLVRRRPQEEQPALMMDLRWRVSVALQGAIAEQCSRSMLGVHTAGPGPSAAAR